jgi:hypothetical protein
MNRDVVVLITHYNDLAGLTKTVDSIAMNQHLHLLIIDDGSDIPPRKSDFAMPDDHITILSLEQNKGIEHALNTGLDFVFQHNRFKYIARLDCGDVSVNNRFTIQKEFLENRPDIKMVGSNVAFVDHADKYLYTYKVPTEHKSIQRMMYLKNCFIHPSVMFRVDAVKEIGYYPTQYKYAEDYAYFFEIQRRMKTANINKVLTFSHLNVDGISSKNRKRQLKSRLAVLLANAKFDGFFMYGFVRTALLLLIPNQLNKNIKTLIYK